MKMNGLGACVVGTETGTASTLATDIVYKTATAGGASIDPCGFSIYLGYTGTLFTTGTVYFFSDFGLSNLSVSLVALLLPLSIIL